MLHIRTPFFYLRIFSFLLFILRLERRGAWYSGCSLSIVFLESALRYRLSRIIFSSVYLVGRLCDLVVRVLGYRSGGLGSIPGTTRKNVVGLEQGPLSLVSTTEEILNRKVAAPV
jgi:hypothetical protein